MEEASKRLDAKQSEVAVLRDRLTSATAACDAEQKRNSEVSSELLTNSPFSLTPLSSLPPAALANTCPLQSQPPISNQKHNLANAYIHSTLLCTQLDNPYTIVLSYSNRMQHLAQIEPLTVSSWQLWPVPTGLGVGSLTTRRPGSIRTGRPSFVMTSEKMTKRALSHRGPQDPGNNQSETRA